VGCRRSTIRVSFGLTLFLMGSSNCRMSSLGGKPTRTN
jgi:hypothetical protein